MEGSDQLLAIAEIGATFAGFTGVIAALRQAPGADFTEATRLSFWLMIEFALVTIFFSLAPFAVFNFTGAVGLVWAIPSALMAAFIVAHVLVISRFARTLMTRGEWPRVAPFIAVLLFGTVCITQLLNATGIVFSQSYAAYFIGLCLFLLLASGNFILLLRALLAGTRGQ